MEREVRGKRHRMTLSADKPPPPSLLTFGVHPRLLNRIVCCHKTHKHSWSCIANWHSEKGQNHRAHTHRMFAFRRQFAFSFSFSQLDVSDIAGVPAAVAAAATATQNGNAGKCERKWTHLLSLTQPATQIHVKYAPYRMRLGQKRSSVCMYSVPRFEL